MKLIFTNCCSGLAVQWGAIGDVGIVVKTWGTGDVLSVAHCLKKYHHVYKFSIRFFVSHDLLSLVLFLMKNYSKENHHWPIGRT